MNKLEYDTISVLLKEQEMYKEVLRGFEEGAMHYVVSKHLNFEECTRYQLDSDDEEFFIAYFEKKLEGIEGGLKRLGYYD